MVRQSPILTPRPNDPKVPTFNFRVGYGIDGIRRELNAILAKSADGQNTY